MQEEAQKAAVEQPMQISSWTILPQGEMNHQGHPGSEHHHHHQRSSKVTVNGDDGVFHPGPTPQSKKYGQMGHRMCRQPQRIWNFLLQLPLGTEREGNAIPCLTLMSQTLMGTG